MPKVADSPIAPVPTANSCRRWCCILVMFGIFVLNGTPASAQMGGGGMGGGGMGGGGAQAPAGPEKAKFRDHVHAREGLALRRERGDAIVASVRVRGNRTVETSKIAAELETRKGRFYDSETVLADVRRLNEMGSFEHVTFNITQIPAGQEANVESGGEAIDGLSGNAENTATGQVVVTFIVQERPMVTQVIYHGNRAMNDRELGGRAGITKGDPLSQFSIESGRRRLIDYYQDEGFNQATIESTIGLPNDPNAVVYRINEGPKERIAAINVEGSTIVTEARLKKIVQSRGPMAGVLTYIGNTADLKKIDQDVNVLSSYYHNLGFLTATVGRRIEYDISGKWMTVTFVVNEGPRFTIGDIQIIGNEFITEQSLRARLELVAGDQFNGTIMRRDIGEIIYGYGELGFIYAEVNPKTIMRDENGVVDLVYEISEGDRWKIGQISVNIDGEPHLMRETVMLNLIDMREGDWIDRRTLELSRRRIERGQLLETNPAIAAPPDIKVVPREDMLR